MRRKSVRRRSGAGKARARSISSRCDGPWRDVWHRAAFFDLPTQGIAVISLVGMQDFARRKALQQGRSRRATSDLPTGEQEIERAAILVGQGRARVRGGLARADCGPLGRVRGPGRCPEAVVTARLQVWNRVVRPDAAVGAYRRSSGALGARAPLPVCRDAAARCHWSSGALPACRRACRRSDTAGRCPRPTVRGPGVSRQHRSSPAASYRAWPCRL